MNVMEMIRLADFWKNAKTEEEDGKQWITEDSEDYKEIMDILWDNLFIGSHWNPTVKHHLEINGYHCWIGDGDSFGILVACITKDGKNLSIG